VRDYFRKKAVDELLNADLPVTVMGAGWNHYSHKKEHNLKRAKEVPFALSFERIAKEHILLNVSPIFSHGMHDRVPAGMANHTAVLTDQNPYLQKHFEEGREIAFFSLTKEGDLTEKAGKLLEDRAWREHMEECAYEKFCGELTWECRAREILSLVR
jgi:spore maturation protein CgeB